MIGEWKTFTHISPRTFRYLSNAYLEIKIKFGIETYWYTGSSCIWQRCMQFEWQTTHSTLSDTLCLSLVLPYPTNTTEKTTSHTPAYDFWPHIPLSLAQFVTQFLFIYSLVLNFGAHFLGCILLFAYVELRDIDLHMNSV